MEGIPLPTLGSVLNKRIVKYKFITKKERSSSGQVRIPFLLVTHILNFSERIIFNFTSMEMVFVLFEALLSEETNPRLGAIMKGKKFPKRNTNERTQIQHNPIWSYNGKWKQSHFPQKMSSSRAREICFNVAMSG